MKIHTSILEWIGINSINEDLVKDIEKHYGQGFITSNDPENFDLLFNEKNKFFKASKCVVNINGRFMIIGGVMISISLLVYIFFNSFAFVFMVLFTIYGFILAMKINSKMHEVVKNRQNEITQLKKRVMLFQKLKSKIDKKKILRLNASSNTNASKLIMTIKHRKKII